MACLVKGESRWVLGPMGWEIRYFNNAQSNPVIEVDLDEEDEEDDLIDCPKCNGTGQK